MAKHRRRTSFTLPALLALALGAACERTPSGPAGPGPAASVRIDTPAPTTLCDTDMVVVRASVLDASGNVLPNETVVWKSLVPEVIAVSSSGHLLAHESPFINPREARIVASVASNPSLTDTTTAYLMHYARFVYLAPNVVLPPPGTGAPAPRIFGQLASLAVGESAALHATGYMIACCSSTRFPTYDSASVDQAPRWISRSPDVATVDANGVVTGRGNGVATIVVETRGQLLRDSGVVVVQTPTWRFARVSPDANSCGLTTDSTAACWGSNLPVTSVSSAGAVVGSRFPAVSISGILKFRSLTTGSAFACGITTDGVTYCWVTSGSSMFGIASAQYVPVAFGGDLRFATVQSGDGYACGLTADGVLYCWGNNSSGQLGDGTTVSRSTPAPVYGDLRFTAVTAGTATCGLAVSGDSYCWGFGGSGQLGNGGTDNKSTPTLVVTNQRFTQLAAGGNSVCGQTAAGLLYCWGINLDGELGDGTTTNRTTPVPVAGGNVFTSFTMGESIGCGLLAGGQALCWGYNHYGSVGDGTFVSVRSTPTAVSGGLRFTSIESGSLRTCGLAGGVWYCWGDNTTGAMGINQMYSVSTPAKLAAVSP